MHRTKIIATAGPSCKTKKVLTTLIREGCDAFRLNFSHGTHEEHARYAIEIRDAAAAIKKHVPIVQDLCGPKLRIGEVAEPFTLKKGDEIVFTSKKVPGTKEKVSFEHRDVLKSMRKKDRFYLSDGTIEVEVREVDGDEVRTVVLVGDVLSSHKGVNIPKLRMDIPAHTDEDIKDLKFGMRLGFEWVALSFVKDATDVENVKKVAKKDGSDVCVISKIERREALKHVDEIIAVSDGLLVARGDLGVEASLESVPTIQKDLIRKANEAAIPVIVATQMLKSMTLAPYPTRAEATDVANAVLDGADSVLLSEETASGQYPMHAVRTMKKIIQHAERIYPFYKEFKTHDTTQAISSAACLLARDMKAKAIITFTRSGGTALQVSRYRPECPTLVAAHDESTLRKLGIVWGAYTLWGIERGPEVDIDTNLRQLVERAVSARILRRKDTVIVTSGYPMGKPGTTNSIKFLKAEDFIGVLSEFLHL